VTALVEIGPVDMGAFSREHVRNSAEGVRPQGSPKQASSQRDVPRSDSGDRAGFDVGRRKNAGDDEVLRPSASAGSENQQSIEYQGNKDPE